MTSQFVTCSGVCRSKVTSPSSAECSIDVAIGFDVTQNTGDTLVSKQPKLQTFLPEITHYISSVPGLCCVRTSPTKPNLGYRLVDRAGRLLYDYDFKEYSQANLSKLMTNRLSEPTYFNTALLKSFGEKFKDKSGAGVKVSQQSWMCCSRTLRHAAQPGNQTSD